MKDAPPQPIRLSDYRPPNHLIDSVALTFRLKPGGTRVLSRIAFRPNPEGLPDGDLRLDGETLRLIRCSIDGKPLTALDYLLTAEGLTVPANRLPKRPFTWEAEVEIDPEDNTALEGLYTSPLKGDGQGKGNPAQPIMFCTQCEAEGFRKITFYPDRPDVMAPFKVRIERPSPCSCPTATPPDGPRLGRMGRPLAQTRLSLRAGGGRSGGASGPASPPPPGPWTSPSGSAPATRTNAPTPWMR
jgi:aminopeptidase N